MLLMFGLSFDLKTRNKTFIAGLGREWNAEQFVHYRCTDKITPVPLKLNYSQTMPNVQTNYALALKSYSVPNNECSVKKAVVAVIQMSIIV